MEDQLKVLKKLFSVTTSLFLALAMIAGGLGFSSEPLPVYAEGEENETVSQEEHDATQIWLDELDSLSRRLQNNGFHYGTSVKATYQQSLHSNKQVNCGGYVGWALKELGLFDSSKSFYTRGYFENHPGTYTVITVNKTPSQLKGIMQPGDIVRYETMGHHHVFAGWSSSGKPLWYGLGRGMMWTRNVELGYFNNKKIYQLIRINMYSVDAEAEGGTISGSGTYFANDDVQVSYTPNEGYELTKVLIDGEEYDADTFNTTVNMEGLSGGHSVSVEFEPISNGEIDESLMVDAKATAITPVNYRAGPGARFTKVGDFKAGDEVTVICSVKAADGSDWYKIRNGEQIVYSLAECYETEDKVFEGNSSVSGVLMDRANYRALPSKESEELGYFDKNTTVTVTGAKKVGDITWYRVKKDDKVGYVSGNYLKIAVENADR